MAAFRAEEPSYPAANARGQGEVRVSADAARADVRPQVGAGDITRMTPPSSGAGDAAQTVAASVEVEVVTEPAAFLALGREWNAVQARSGTSNLFLSWEWISTWWEVYCRVSVLHVLVARSLDGTITGLAPLHLRRRRLFGIGLLSVVEFIGAGSDVTPDGLDFIVATGWEAVVVAAFASSLSSDARVQALNLRPFAGEASCVALLQAELARHPGLVEVHPHSVCPVMNLPSTWEQFIADRSRNYRKKMGEYERRLARDLKATLRRSETPDDLARDLPVLVRLHRERWGRESRAFRSDEYIRFHERLAGRLLARGALRLFTLESGTRPLAMLYCFCDGHRYYYYQAGRDPELSRYRVGFVVMHQAMKAAIEEGVEAFDFLRGAEEYKYHWAVRHQTNVELRYWKTWLGRVVGQVEGLLRRRNATGSSAAR